MKKILIISTLILLTIFSNAYAERGHGGDRGWATAGKILTGVVVADVIFNHMPSHSHYNCQPVYYPQPQPIWVAGHFVTVEQRVWVQDPPMSVQEVINGQVVYRMVQAGHWQTVYQQVWIDGHWQY